MEGTEEQRNNSHRGENLKPWQYKKGQSGNPGGRPLGSKSLKNYAKEMLLKMTDEEREEFLHGIPKKDIWEMAEAKASQGIGQADDLEKFSVSLVTFDDLEKDNNPPQSEDKQNQG